jgi:hypothetical protein
MTWKFFRRRPIVFSSPVANQRSGAACNPQENMHHVPLLLLLLRWSKSSAPKSVKRLQINSNLLRNLRKTWTFYCDLWEKTLPGHTGLYIFLVCMGIGEFMSFNPGEDAPLTHSE